MRSYFAICGNSVYADGFLGCIKWSQQELASGVKIVKIASARPGDPHARVVGEVTSAGFSLVTAGRVIPISLVKRQCLAS